MPTKKLTELGIEVDTDDLRVAYEQYCEDWRYYDRTIWQLVNVVILINAGLIGLALNAPPESNPGILYLAAAFFTTVLEVAFLKHTFFADARDKNKRRLEEAMGIEKLVLRYYPKDWYSGLRLLVHKPKARVWIELSMVIVIIAELYQSYILLFPGS